MSFVARMINRAKWQPSPDLGEDAIAADAVTGDLRTTANTLSFWDADDGTEPPIQEAALALAAGRDRLDKLDIAWLEVASLEGAGLTFEKTAGDTPVVDLRERHRDLVRLDLVRLGAVGQIVARAVRAENRFRRLTRAQVLALLVKAVRAGRLRLDDLSDGVRTDVAASVSSGEG